MVKIWLVTSCYKRFFYKEIERSLFDIKFGVYRKTQLAENEYLVHVPFDVYDYYFKS